MKKRYKFLMATAAGIAIPAAINHYIFKMYSGPYRTEFDQLIYNSRYGAIRYTRTGTGKPLLLIHGIGVGASSAQWNNCVVPLSKNYTVYTMDLLGFGNSDKPAISLTSYLYTTIINEFIENVIGQKVLVAANSSGADFTVLAQSFKPENFEKLLLIAPPGICDATTGCPLPAPFNKLIDMPILGTTVYNIMSSKLYIAWFLRQNMYYNTELVNMKMVKRYHEAAHSGGVGSKYGVIAFLSGYLSTNIVDKLANIQIPVHILWGGSNLLNPINNLYNLRKMDNGIQYTVIEGARALPHSEYPKAFVKLCKEFF